MEISPQERERFAREIHRVAKGLWDTVWLGESNM